MTLHILRICEFPMEVHDHYILNGLISPLVFRTASYFTYNYMSQRSRGRDEENGEEREMDTALQQLPQDTFSR